MIEKVDWRKSLRNVATYSATLIMGSSVAYEISTTGAEVNAPNAHVLRCLNLYASLPTNHGLKSSVISRDKISVTAKEINLNEYIDNLQRTDHQRSCDDVKVLNFTDLEVLDDRQFRAEAELIGPGHDNGGTFNQLVHVNKPFGCDDEVSTKYITYTYNPPTSTEITSIQTIRLNTHCAQ